MGASRWRTVIEPEGRERELVHEPAPGLQEQVSVSNLQPVPAPMSWCLSGGAWVLLAVSFLDEGLCIEPRRGSPSTPLFGRVDPHKVSGCRHCGLKILCTSAGTAVGFLVRTSACCIVVPGTPRACGGVLRLICILKFDMHSQLVARTLISTLTEQTHLLSAESSPDSRGCCCCCVRT